MSSEKNEHTPGPWDYDPTGDDKRICVGIGLVDGPNGYDVAEVYSDDCDPDEALANARLIAAAPDLLEALEGLLVFAEDAETKALVGDEGCLWPCEEARTAIAKARGSAMLAARSENNGE